MIPSKCSNNNWFIRLFFVEYSDVPLCFWIAKIQKRFVPIVANDICVLVNKRPSYLFCIMYHTLYICQVLSEIGL